MSNNGRVAINFARWPASDETSPLLLFVHGQGDTLETWSEVIDEARCGRGAIAVDLRGHGYSGRVKGEYRLPDYGQDIADLLSDLSIGKVAAIGQSLGAMVVLSLAAKHPEMFSAIVLEDPPFFARKIMEEFPEQRHERYGNFARMAGSGRSVAELAELIRTANPAVLETEATSYARNLFLTDEDAIMHTYDHRNDWSSEVESLLESIKCPALVMHGKFALGGWNRSEDIEKAKLLLPHGEFSYWDDSGHVLHDSDPSRFSDEVSSFVTAIFGSSTKILD